MKKSTLTLLLTAFIYFLATAQPVQITLGNGQVNNTQNTNTTYPAPYGNWYQGAKHQMIVLASELTAAGMTAGNIMGIGFNVKTVEGTPLNNFSIAMGLTNKSQWQANDNFITSLTTYYSSASYTETSGWNMHNFTTPFVWDGVSNVVIETCFNNSSYTNNAITYYSSTNFTSVLYHRRDDLTVCSTNTQGSSSFYTSSNRPDIRFLFQPPNTPPVTDFSANVLSSCSGVISFTDLSTPSPTSWLWDFGDGTTSTLQNPTHTYSSSGTYTVTLTATNQYGSSSETKTNYITINLSGISVVPASCTPATQDGSLGFGITNVTFNTINENTGDASEGYVDNTCIQTTVFAGQTYPISITHSQPTTHNCIAWIDYNNDGIFSNNEKIIENSSALNTTGNVTISPTAILNTPLRMRVMVDYDLNAMPTPCTDPVYGQAEDYTIIVEQDTNPPVANFEATPQYSCDGTIQFTDLSTNIPTSWLWDFGDGTTSVQQNPVHTYNADGLYDIQLIVTNAFGSDTITLTNHINIYTSGYVLTPQCQPQTLGTCCKYGIYSVTFHHIFFGIYNLSNDATEGYQDFSCSHQTTIKGDTIYNINITTGPDNPQDTRVWIDFNNDGTFDNSEMVFEKLNTYNPSGQIQIPATGVVWDTPLRMRILSDEVGASLNSCNDLIRGQVEDYGITISEPVEDTTGSNVSIAENNTSYIKVFPNPAKDRITVKNIQYKMSEISIINIMGQTISVLTINDYQHQIDINNLPKGVYLLFVRYTNGTLAKVKFTKA